MTTPDNWQLTWTDPDERNFSLECLTCTGTFTGGADTHDNALDMIQNIEENHTHQ